MHMIHSFINIHSLICAVGGAVIYALLSAAVRRAAMQVRRQLRKWRRAQPGYRQYQELLREQSRSRMASIMAETDDPWAAPWREAVRR